MFLICSYLLGIYSLVPTENFGLIKTFVAKLIKSINTLIAKLRRCGLARTKKFVSNYPASSFKLFILTYFFYKRKALARCCPVNFAKFFREPFFIEHLRWRKILTSHKKVLRQKYLINPTDKEQYVFYHQAKSCRISMWQEVVSLHSSYVKDGCGANLPLFGKSNDSFTKFTSSFMAAILWLHILSFKIITILFKVVFQRQSVTTYNPIFVWTEIVNTVLSPINGHSKGGHIYLADDFIFLGEILFRFS